MKTLLSLLTAICLFFALRSPNQGVIIKGIAKNADGKFMRLHYVPFLRGNPSFEGFTSVGTLVNTDGNFTLESEKITTGATYCLSFGTKGFSFPLFESDNITFNFDANDIEHNVFATGKGAGKINVLRLEDFKQLPFNLTLTPEEFAAQNTSKIRLNLTILNAIYNRKNLDAIKGLKSKKEAERIIKESPLSREEYIFLKNTVTLKNYLLYDFITAQGGNTIIKTNDTIFKTFNTKEYSNITTENYNQVLIYTILKFEYIREYQKKNPAITANQWESLSSTTEAFIWMRGYAKDNFPAAVFDRLFCEFFVWTTDIAKFNQENYDYLNKNCNNKKCIGFINNYVNTARTAMYNLKHNLGAPEKTLNSANFNLLLEQFKGKNKLIVFWSAQYAGASILDDLCVIRAISDTYKLDIVNICIDSEANKNLWASRVISNNWTGQQYFMPVENNEKTLHKFSSEKINAFCANGATYTFLAADGTIHNNIENPMQLASGKIKDYIRN